MSDVVDVHDHSPAPDSACPWCRSALAPGAGPCPACGIAPRAVAGRPSPADGVVLLVIAAVSVAVVTGILVTVAG